MAAPQKQWPEVSNCMNEWKEIFLESLEISWIWLPKLPSLHHSDDAFRILWEEIAGFRMKRSEWRIVRKGNFSLGREKVFLHFLLQEGKGVFVEWGICALCSILRKEEGLLGSSWPYTMMCNFSLQTLEERCWRGAKKKCLHFSSHFREVQKELWIGLSRCVPGFFSYIGWKRPQIF